MAKISIETTNKNVNRTNMPVIVKLILEDIRVAEVYKRMYAASAYKYMNQSRVLHCHGMDRKEGMMHHITVNRTIKR